MRPLKELFYAYDKHFSKLSISTDESNYGLTRFWRIFFLKRSLIRNDQCWFLSFLSRYSLQSPIKLARKPSHVFSSCNSGFAWNGCWEELGHVHVQYIDVHSVTREDVRSLCSPWTGITINRNSYRETQIKMTIMNFCKCEQYLARA